MNKYNLLSGLVLAVTLSACGGGSSDSGPGDSSNIADGEWNGSANVTAEFSSGGSKPDIPNPVRIRIVVRSGTVFIEKFEDGNVTGQSSTESLNGNGFELEIERNFTAANDTTCGGAYIYRGTISGMSASGEVSGGLDCVDNKGPYQQFYTGSFSATQ